MSVTYGFFNAIDNDRTYDADQMSEYFDGLVSDGVYNGVGGGLQVVAGNGMNVNVRTGRAIIECKWLKNDATETIALTPAHPTLNRISAIVVRLNRDDRIMELAIKDGAPASTPLAPVMQNDGSIREMCLAMIYVAAGAASITQSNITDKRGSNLCRWVTGLVEQVDTSQLYDQWEDAYRQYYEEETETFERYCDDTKESWIAFLETLGEDLNVSMNAILLHSEYETISSENTIPVGIASYDRLTDILQVYVNGMRLSEETEYIYVPQGNCIVLAHSLAEGQTVTFTVLKCVIGTAIDSVASVINELNEKYAKCTADSGWQTLELDVDEEDSGAVLPYDQDNVPQIRCAGNQVTIRGDIKTSLIRGVIAYVPVKYRPDRDLYYTAGALYAGKTTVVTMLITKTGEIRLEGSAETISSEARLTISTSYMLADYKSYSAIGEALDEINGEVI